MVDSNNFNENKFNLENLDNNIQTFEEESNEYAGEDVLLNFIVKDTEVAFSESFKGGQDWEYVKYKLGGKLDVDSDNIVLYLRDKPVIPYFSIIDVEMSEKDIIVIEIQA